MEDFDTILEGLKEKRAALDQAIEAIEKLQGHGGGQGNTKPGKLSGTYTGMTVIEAAKKYLKMVNRPASTREIVAALEKGGIEHHAKDFYASVYAILRQRQQAHDDIGRVATDWTLKEQEG